MATMVAYTARLGVDPVDPVAIGRYWADRIERMLASCVADRGLLAPSRSLDVRFTDLMGDEEGQVDRIYECAGLVRTAASRSAAAAYTQAHPRGRHGSVRYRWGPLGVDPSERREALAFYEERFGTAREEPD